MFQFLLLCVLSLFVQLPEGTPNSFYYGEMDIGERVFRFVITTSLDKNGKWQGELKSIDEGGAKFKLDSLELDDSELSFQLNQTKAFYSGKFEKSGKREHASGSWAQGGGKFDLSLRRVDSAPLDSPKETWLGEMKAGIQTLSMQVRVYEAQGGLQKVYFDSLSQGAGGFKALLKKEGESIQIEVRSLASTYTGKQSADGNEIVGKWKQGIGSFDLSLKKTNGPMNSDVKPPKRPQTPQAPFPYDAEEVIFENTSADIKLSGTLTIPHAQDLNQRFPVAVLVSGSGPQDRDESLAGHKPFWVLADHLSRKGFAVLRYDERGVGKSTGQFANATTADFTQDAISAIEFLKKHSRIDVKRIGIIGHSEGGLVAPLVASQDTQLAWVVLMASPGVNGEQIMYSQGRLIILAEGGDENTVKRNRLVQDAAFSAVATLKPGESPSMSLDALAEQVIESAKKIDGFEQAIGSVEDQAAVKKLLGESIKANVAAMNTPWFRYFMAHEPGPVLEKVRCPVLAINGENDVQVDPKLNLSKIAASLKAGGNQNATIVELPGLNHLFQTSQRGAVSEYEAIEETIAPLALNTISDWLTKLFP